MALSDAQIQAALEEWVMDYCHNDFSEGIPATVHVFIEQALPIFKGTGNVQSESLGDYSVSFNTNFPDTMLALLRPYRKMKTISGYYNDNRRNRFRAY